MTRVLILSAPYGAGHERVADALAEAFRAEGASVEVHDHFRRFVPRPIVAASLSLFWAMLCWTPKLWGFAYDLSSRMDSRSVGMAGLGRLGAAALGRYLEARRPDVVVHVHPTPAGALAWLEAKGAVRVPHGIVLTDFVAHSQWFPAGLDRYFVATEEIQARAIALGVPAERVVASGIPVGAAFRAPADRLAARAELGLPADQPALLVTGGMRGTLGGIADVCEALAAEPQSFHAVVVCGDHRRLAATLGHRHGGDARFRIFGRVSNMDRLMAAVDVVVSKAGAVTSAEALALGRPLVLYRSLPGQERGNEVYLERKGAATRARDRAALGRVLREVLRDPTGVSRGALAARQLARPDAASVVAKEMLALVGRQ
jgi:processive 1,2-diacylglycerol beta-glucosyltransferase